MNKENQLAKRENQLLAMCNTVLENDFNDFESRAGSGEELSEHIYTTALVLKADMLGDIEIEPDVAYILNHQANLVIRRQNIGGDWTTLKANNVWFDENVQDQWDIRDFKYELHKEDYVTKIPGEPQTVVFNHEKCYFEFGKYGNKQTSITLYSTETGEPYLVATVSVENEVDSSSVCIKTWGENELIYDVLRDAGIISPLNCSVPLGRVFGHVCELLIDPVLYNEQVHAYINYILEQDEEN